eukprot:jgi/Psemu1/9919/gm1.9919_g
MAPAIAPLAPTATVAPTGAPAAATADPTATPGPTDLAISVVPDATLPDYHNFQLHLIQLMDQWRALINNPSPSTVTATGTPVTTSTKCPEQLLLFTRPMRLTGQQTIFFAYLALQSDTKAQIFDLTAELHWLLGLHICTWKTGTTVGFATQWFAKLDDINVTAYPETPMSYVMTHNHLLAACAGNNALTDVFHIATESGADSSLKQCLTFAATHCNAKQSLSRTDLSINLHHWSPDSSPFDLQVFAASQTVNHSFHLPESIWKQLLSHDGMSKWTSFCPNNQRLIVNSLQTSNTADGSTQTVDDPPVSTKPITHRSYSHGFSQDDNGLFMDNLNVPPGTDKMNTSPSPPKAPPPKDTRPLKSLVSLGHPAHFLADNPDILYKKQGNIYVQHTILFHIL